jgi:hypothetical protein
LVTDFAESGRGGAGRSLLGFSASLMPYMDDVWGSENNFSSHASTLLMNIAAVYLAVDARFFPNKR